MNLETLEDKFKKRIQDVLGLEESHLKNFLLEMPAPHIKADASISWPMSAARVLKSPPMQIAKVVMESASMEGCCAARICEPGFVNLEFPDGFLSETLQEMLANEKFFEEGFYSRENINIEFVSANPTGPLHLASGRAATLGDSLVRIMKFLGHRVSSEYYVNDTGRQVDLLGLSLKARYKQEEIPEDGYKGEYLKDISGKIPDGTNLSDREFSEFAVREILKQHKKDLMDFGVEFDRWFLESELRAENGLNKALDLLKTRGMVYERDKALWFGSSSEQTETDPPSERSRPERADDKDRVLVKSGGNPTYFLSDIAYHMNKFARGFDRVIDIWGADHHGYVPRMKSAISAIGKNPQSFHVIIHQMVYLKKGNEIIKMSKREGEFVTLRELVDEVGKDACRFFFAARSPNSHLNFDIELAKKQSQENPVYYVQYVHARICSIFRNAKEKEIDINKNPEFSKIAINEEERALIVKLIWFEKILKNCVKDLSPHNLTTYLLELAGLFHSFYDKHRVLSPTSCLGRDEIDMETTAFRLFLLKGVKFAISKGLNLLGVSAPERM